MNAEWKKMTWKQAKISYFETQFGNVVSEYEKYDDDRKVYVNMYNRIMKALNSLPEEPDTFIRVAVWRQINIESDMMNGIRDRFID